MTHRSTHLDKDAKFEPSRSRRLNAIKAKTNGMLAIHAARRQVYLTLRSFIGVISALLASLRRDFIYYRFGKPVKRSIPGCSGYVKFSLGTNLDLEFFTLPQLCQNYMLQSGVNGNWFPQRLTPNFNVD